MEKIKFELYDFKKKFTVGIRYCGNKNEEIGEPIQKKDFEEYLVIYSTGDGTAVIGAFSANKIL